MRPRVVKEVVWLAEIRVGRLKFWGEMKRIANQEHCQDTSGMRCRERSEVFSSERETVV